MPIINGVESTKIIRDFEVISGKDILSTRAVLNGRIPIFAVSASINDRDKKVLEETGFDGWMLKPVDFEKLSFMLGGIVQEAHHRHNTFSRIYGEIGGWFVDASDC